MRGYAFVNQFVNVFFVAASQEKQVNKPSSRGSREDAVEKNDTDNRDFVDFVEDFINFGEEGKKNSIRTSSNKTNISKTSSKLSVKGTQ